jgi:(p)ppGpp synthase/HD superfamily hydrolase
VLEAARFAAERHAAQRRKGSSEEPYVNHLLEVAGLVADAVEEPAPEMLVAALLHDVVEDTTTTAAEVRTRFGDEVAGLVAELTDDKSLPKQERKRLQVERAGNKSAGAQAIKLADLVSNLRSLLVNPPTGWSSGRKEEYVAWARMVKERLAAPPAGLVTEFGRVEEQFGRKARQAQCSTESDGRLRDQ